MITQEDVRLERPLKEVWSQTLTLLEKRIHGATMESWLKPAQLAELYADEAVIKVINDVGRSLVSKCQPAIAEALSEVLRRPVKVRLLVDQTMQPECYTPSIGNITVIPPAAPSGEYYSLSSAASISPETRIANAHLNSKYMFSSFVIGSHNQFCHSAAMAVADKPGQAYNPLFIYGGVGLGKTHLMQAVGHQVLQTMPGKVVRYMSGETFTNEMIQGIGSNRMADFRKRYRQVDVLLVDDIQFIENKEGVQEEFFHTFNALRESGRQIVLTCDRPPRALSLLAERLRSRFECGLIADIQPPDVETRMAILQKKCELEKLNVPSDVLEYIASIFTNNVRELEGALVRSHAYANLTGMVLTPAAVAGILQGGAPVKAKPLTLDRIFEVIADQYHVEISELKSAKRSHHLSLPRHLAMYYANKLMKMSLPCIGQAFDSRAHTSVLYAVKRIEKQISEDPLFSQTVREISHRLEH
jgi:chromosomal replication initiator protein